MVDTVKYVISLRCHVRGRQCDWSGLHTYVVTLEVGCVGGVGQLVAQLEQRGVDVVVQSPQFSAGKVVLELLPHLSQPGRQPLLLPGGE